MKVIVDWLIELPQHMAQGVTWLTTPIQIGSLNITPLAIFGSGFLAFVGVVLVLKIKNLII